MIVLLLIQMALAQIQDCPLNISHTQPCNDTYSPVCGFNVTQHQISTFPNYCHACKATSVVQFKNGQCDFELNLPVAQLSPNKTIGGFTILAECTEPRPNVCQTNSIKTCGILSTDCGNGKCIAEFLNQCEACSNHTVTAYFLGDCSEYIPEPLEMTCYPDMRPTDCSTQKVVQTCGFHDDTVQCLHAPCLEPFLNPCSACLQTNVKSYFKGNCNQYANLFSKTNMQQSTTSEPEAYTYCDIVRPATCGQDESRVCGVRKYCHDGDCTVEFENSCNACLDQQIEGYYDGVCNYAYMMTMIMLLWI